MVVLKQLLPRRAYKILEAVATQAVMIAIVGPFFFIFFFMFWNSLKRIRIMSSFPRSSICPISAAEGGSRPWTFPSAR